MQNAQPQKQETILKAIAGKTQHTLNLNESMARAIVENAKKEIGYIQVSQSKLQPDYTAAKEMFDEAKKIFDSVQIQMTNFDEKIREQENIISVMTHFRKSGGAKLQLLREPETNTDKKARKVSGSHSVRVKWQDEAADILAKKYEFIDPQELFEIVKKQPHVIDAIGTMKNASDSSLRHSTIFNWVKHAKQSLRRDNKKSFKPLLVWYNGKIGLYTWFDVNKGVPTDPTHMKQFMYGTSNEFETA